MLLDSFAEIINGLYLYCFGTGGSAFVSILTIVVASIFGYKTTDDKYLVAWPTINIIFCISLFVLTSNPVEGIMGATSFFLLFQIPYWTSFVNAYNLAKRNEDEVASRLKSMSSSEIVEIIDNYFDCLIGINHPWPQQNWFCLNEQNKGQFIEDNREIINNELYLVNDVVELIQLMRRCESLNKSA